jgi:hypothetical protein
VVVNKFDELKQSERKVMKNKLALAQAATYGPSTRKEQGMDTKKLTRTTVFGLVGLAVCLLAWPVAASAAKPVTRPVIVIEGHMTLVVDSTGAYHFTDRGWASHTGLYSNSGSGIIDLATGQFVSGTGVVVAANGDTLDWEIGNTPNQVVYTGGTGRFQGATGGFPVNVTSLTLVAANPDGTLTFAVTYDGSGTITY